VNDPGEEPSSSASQIGRYSGYGLALGATVAFFTWVGMKLDVRLGTSPLFVILGGALGFGGGMYRLIHDVTSSSRDERS
jgi:F0F1-type ATP synthase assembly protein I